MTDVATTGAIGSVRKAVRIRRSADAVWARLEDPARIQEWFPGIVASTVDGTTRVVTLGSGLSMPEEIVTHDDIARRFQYRITFPIFRSHLSTIDVIDLGDESCLAVYSIDAEPRTFALMIGAAAGDALEQLRDAMEVEAPEPTTGAH